MNNPLRSQLTEYDCGPTSMLHAVSYLFPRDDIPPEIVRSIMLYCLDCFGEDGTSGKCGTSCMAMMFLSNWINGYRQAICRSPASTCPDESAGFMVPAAKLFYERLSLTAQSLPWKT